MLVFSIPVSIHRQEIFSSFKTIKMDTSTLLFAGGIVGFIVILIVVLSYTTLRQRRKEIEKYERFFHQVAETSGLSLTKKEFLRNRMIGWDGSLNKMVFVDYSKEPMHSDIIELKEVSSCRMSVNNDTVTEKVRGENKVTDTFIASVKLQLKLRNGHAVPTEFPFYKYGVDSLHELEHLKQAAGKWNELVNEHCG
jgi:hypothetical protein